MFSVTLGHCLGFSCDLEGGIGFDPVHHASFPSFFGLFIMLHWHYTGAKLLWGRVPYSILLQTCTRRGDTIEAVVPNHCSTVP